VPREERARAQLLRLCKEYDLSRWQLTDLVQIQSWVIPHSHPVLTLNARWVEDDEYALATYLHEQLHWFVSAWELENPARARKADRELLARYPVIPAPDEGGAHDVGSTYLHLIVCSLEFAALCELQGVESARRTLAGATWYQWIYATILREWDYFDEFLRRYEVVVP
jgi:hypothetical protein